MFLSVWNSEPDDTHHLENCVALNNQGAISDEDCTEQHSYLCEYTSSKWDVIGNLPFNHIMQVLEFKSCCDD